MRYLVDDRPTCDRCGTIMRRYEPDQRTHPNCGPGVVLRIQITRQLTRLGMGHCTCPDVRVPDYSCPHCKEFAARLSRSGRDNKPGRAGGAV